MEFANLDYAVRDRVAEITMRHDLVKAVGAAPSDEAAELANLLLDQAHILDGEVPADPAAFARRLNAFVVRGLGKTS